MTTNDQRPTDAIEAAVAAVLRAEKAAQKLTYPTLAEQTGIPVISLKRYFGGEREIGLRSFTRIAKALGMEPAEIWTKAAERM